MPRFPQQNCWAVSFILNGLVFYDLGQPNSDIKTALDLGSELGTILFAVPLGQLLIMPFQEN
jgi:hypothetical protein